MPPFISKLLLLVNKSIGFCYKRSSLLLFYFLLVLRLQSFMILLGVLQRVADQLHSQSLDLDLVDLLLLQSQLRGLDQPLRYVSYSLKQLQHALPYLQLLLQRFVELEHVEVGHQHEVVGGGFLESLDDEVVHHDEIVKEEGDVLREEDTVRVEFMCFFQRMNYGYEDIDDVVQFEDPNEPDFGAPPEDIIIGYVSLLAGMVQLLVGGHFHEVVIHWDQQFFMDELLQLLRLRLQFIMLMLARLRKGFDLFIENNITDVVL